MEDAMDVTEMIQKECEENKEIDTEVSRQP